MVLYELVTQKKMTTTHYGYTLALVFCHFVLLVATLVTDPSEVNALLAVRNTLTDPMRNLRNWNEGDPCTSNWTGLSCSNTSGADGYLHVKVLNLMDMNLSGILVPGIGLLSQLEILDFMWNGLTGVIPKDIGKITSLKLLLLNGNNFSGSLPEELGNLTNLNRLQVDQNQLSGPIPKSFANLVNVKHLHMNNNSFTGQIPPELSVLPSLLHLLVDNNNLSGYLPPELAQLPNLRILQLDNNNFSGANIPESFGSFIRLVKLSLRNCSLQGAVPDISGISNLSYLDLSLNYLIGPIPEGNLSEKITTINLSNNLLNESIPESFSHLPSLQKLSLRNNNLSGLIPASIWENIPFNSSAKLWIDLRNNSLSGISGSLDPPTNVTLRVAGNPVCQNSNLHIDPYCQSGPGDPASADYLTHTKVICRNESCPVDNFFEYVPASPEPCFCSSPLRIGYRLKSPSFSYFRPYVSAFEEYVTQSLSLELYQLSVDTLSWEGTRLSMYLKLFPAVGSSTFNKSEVQRIRSIFASWKFNGSDFFGPYELLNFTLIGPYANMNIEMEEKERNISKGLLACIIIAAVACAIAISAVVSFVITRRQMKDRYVLSRKRLSSNIYMKIDGVKAFTFKEVAIATDNFSSSTQVGQGGYGKVYRGILSDGTTVAIKRAQEGSLQGQKEFLTEIELLSRLHHRNLVSLIGYCDEEGEQMLIYEFMPNGSLKEWLSGNLESKGNLNFGTRLRIAMGSAKGILYLHTEANPPIFHRDIKSSNILLDSSLTAKVADFGLSRLAPLLEDEGTVPMYVSTVVKGTPGYLDPEYFLTHKLTDKSDVYSLGIVFLELLTGMQPISHGKNIAREVKLAHQSGLVFSITDSRMGSYPAECLERFLALGLSCCHDKQEKRPSMLDVVRQLETILQMMPILPSETQSSISSTSTSSAGRHYLSNLAMYSGKSTSSSSNSNSNSNSNYMRSSEEIHMSFSVSGSDLVSGVNPTITPR